jgi:dihydroxyacetone kinase-like protein
MAEKAMLDKQFFKEALLKMAELSETQRDYWTALDSAIGDGDHGINLSIGFRGISAQMDELYSSSADIPTLLKKAGMILLSKVGGASGPLYGSFFMKMGTPVAGKEAVTFSEFADMLQAGVTAIQVRGKAELKDKTMLDALLPGVEYLQTHKEDANVLSVMEQTITLMHEGADSTIPLIAKKGRAMRLGERAVGAKDPGSESSWMLMNVFYEALKTQQAGAAV